MMRNENSNMSGGRGALLRQIAAEDFALYEVALYLDAYPHNQKALAYYRQHRERAGALRAEYERRYGPLTLSGNQSNTEWQWVGGPWPWESEAN